MGILPRILEDENYQLPNINEKREENSNTKTKRTYIIDFINKKMKYTNGKMETNNQELATKMFIQKLLLTELGKWKYHENYGVNYVTKTYGNRFSRFNHKAEIELNIREQLLKYHDIDSVVNIEIENKVKTLFIKIVVKTKNKNILEWEEEIVA